MVEKTAHLLAPDGCWLAMKGTQPNKEQAELPPGLAVKTVALQVPGEVGQRHLVILRRVP
jgi:16S rRNA (guanine527-N7)-methyltransferase